MTSDARPRSAGEESDFPPVEDVADETAPGGSAAEDGTAEETAPAGEAGGTGEPAAGTTARRGRKRRSADDEPAGDAPAADGPSGRGRPALPLVPVLGVLLVLLLGAVAFLWFTRPEASTVRTDTYVEALQAARSGVVDMTSFDHLTLDDDIEQVRGVTTGDLREEAVAELEGRRQEITDAQAVVSTEIVGAGVVRAGEEEATVMMVIQSTQQSAANPQAQLVRYRIEVELQKTDGRWLLSSITGTGSE